MSEQAVSERMTVYLDYAATAPMSAAALAAYAEAAAQAGNAASVHAAGQRARAYLEQGRALMAAALGASPLELVLNGGGTEGDNQVLLGLAAQHPGGHLITSASEHSAVLAPARVLESRGYAVTFLPPDRSGHIDPAQVEAALRPDTFLVSIHHANNETGAVQPVDEIARVAHAAGALMHTDAVQSPGVLPIDLHSWNVDFASFSAHKWGGPQGVGALYIRRGLDLEPLLTGGHQERGLRAGTQNVAGVYAAGVAAREAALAQPQTYLHLRALQRQLMTALAGIPDLSYNQPPEGSPKIVNLTVHGADGEALIMNLDLEGVSVSAGSACAAGTSLPSHVLLSMGLSEADARSSLRLSFGAASTQAEVAYAAQSLALAAAHSRP